MKTLSLLLILFLSMDGTEHQIYSFENMDMPMCSKEVFDMPTCYGYANCTACKTCNYCQHCNSGGSCGVCARPSVRRSYPSTSSSKSSGSRSRSSLPSNNEQKPTIPLYSIDKSASFVVLQSTSLRQSATHQSGILLRFKTGDEVTLLEKTNQWWWKVQFKGKTGWVKKQLLKSKN